MTTAVWVRQSHGLANKIDPSRFEYSEKLGVQELAEAVNIDFDITGAISRRLGFEATTITDGCHSFFYAGGECVFVKGSTLCILSESLESRALRAISPYRYMTYCQVGDSIRYMNGSEKGVVKAGASWEYERPTSVRTPDQTRVYFDPPIGTIVRYFSSRVYIAAGKALYYSEAFGPNLFRLATSHVSFPAKIVMVAPVQTGLYVSTDTRIYYLEGTDPKQFSQRVVAQYPAIEGTDVEADGIALNGGKQSPLPVQLFTSTKGICAGLPGGQMLNLTYDRLEYPVSKRGCAVYDGKKYIVSLEA